MSRHSISDPAQRIALTGRQEDVLRLVAKGLTNPQIADRLGVSLDGVKWHIREILGKFGVASREEAVERWREERSSGRRVGHWAGVFLTSTAVRWGGGLAFAGAGAVAGVVYFVDAPGADEPRADVAAEVAPADPAVADGLTLKIESAEGDDTQTTLVLSLQGRPELGRISAPPQGILVDKATGRLAGPPLTITDELGNNYHLRTWQALEPDYRRIEMRIDAMAAGATSLTLKMEGVPFVAPAAETREGQRPPDPSAVIAGPWAATVHEIPRQPVSRYPLDLMALPLAQGEIVPFEVVQTQNGSIVRLRTPGIDPSYGLHFFPWPTLINEGGIRVPSANIGSGWGNEPDPEILEFGFETVHGSVTLSIDPRVDDPSSVDSAVWHCLDPESAKCPTAEEIAVRKAKEKRDLAAIAGLIASQSPPGWTFEIP